ncbi:response regulator transcription factor [Stigmatella aurantiaca]|uniref:DNA-binding response regulator PhoP n=1 Tax=Stigmatella aurantiaca (strain DW4/3-1) TaxID=378806 RepID=E3FWL8_STIAD|nr:response regulator transcription factor [Stigmatella aurantiaca]ADO68531.1 DNA-binding response regulator PhoP [Stigmatella aurantiaca DW4/3-1]
MNPPPTGPRILVVEDDLNLRLTLVDNLEEEGYAVEAASTLAEARAKVRGTAFDVVVLDLMLPDGDGYTLCRELRQAATSSRVLMLTARSLEDDVVKGFEVGADDYVPKPYRLRELLARIRALARRGAGAPVSTEVLTFDRFRVDLASRRILNATGQALELTRTEFDLLVFLLRHAGKALTRDQILSSVWGEDVVVDGHTVDNFVSNLRKKLEWTSTSRFEIRSVRGVGYRLDLLG